MVKESELCIIVLCFCVGFIYSQEDLEKGDDCHNDHHNVPGTCTELKNCPEALEALKQQQYPQICTYDGNLPIVCCPKNRIPGEICKKKCHEYSQLVYKQVEIPSFGIGNSQPTYVNETYCAVKPTFVHNGEDAAPKEFPHMALLGYGEKRDIKWGCGGSLISDQFVLTAGHCLSERGYGSVRWVRLGDLNISSTTDDAAPQEFEIQSLIRHPSYKRPSRYNDIALLKLNRKVNFTDYVRPACLFTENEIPKDRYVVTGWGHLAYDLKQLSDMLQKADVDKFENSDCNQQYEIYASPTKLKDGIVEESQLCAGGKKNDKDTCPGDSGGPMQIYHPEEFCMYSIVGVTSFGQPVCGVKGVPAIYTRVSHYIDWIERTVWP